MKKHSYLVKILKSIYLNINHFLKKYLNKLNLLGNKNQKLKKSVLNRLIITFFFIFFLGMSYLSIPNLYSKSKIKLELENQISQNYGSTFILSDNLNYKIFPIPHFKFLNSELLYANDKIADLINLKVYISFNNLPTSKEPSCWSRAPSSMAYNIFIRRNKIFKSISSFFTLLNISV